MTSWQTSKLPLNNMVKMQTKIRNQKNWLIRKHKYISRTKNDKLVKGKNLRKQARDFLFKNKSPQKMTKIIGLTSNKYKLYLESLFKEGMSWENYGTTWHIDHIIPLSKFNLDIDEEVLKCFNYKNTQPLFPIENNLKEFSILDFNKIKDEFNALNFNDKQLEFISNNLTILYYIDKIREKLHSL